MPEHSVGEIAEVVGGRVEGHAARRIEGVGTLESAGPRQLSFVANPRYHGYLQRTRAGAVLLTEATRPSAPEETACIVVDDPQVALYHALRFLYPAAAPSAGVHSTASVHPSARIEEGVVVGEFVVVGADAVVGAGSVLRAHVVVGDRCRIGAGTEIHPHAVLYDGVRVGDRCLIHSGARIGRQGFGFVWADGGHRKIPHVGGCTLGDEVEIGANCTIDRGSVGDTVIGSGTKLDAQIQIGHNVRVGRFVIMAAQVGVSGSTTIGDGVVIGGQAGIAGHITIGANARIGAQAGVTASVPEGATYSGYPARPHREALRAQGGLFRLPRLIERVRELERRTFGGERDGGDERTERGED